MPAYVVVPVDGSALAEQSIPLATSIARRTGRTLLLLRVVPAPSLYLRHTIGGAISSQELLQLLNQEASAYLRALQERLLESRVPVVTSLAEGEVAETIAYAANRQPRSYIVMTTHGRSGLSRWALGSVTDRVLHLAEVPVIVLPRSNAFQGSRPDLKRVVVPLDGTPLAEQALPHATELALTYNAELLLFHALAPLPLRVTRTVDTEVKENWYDGVREEAEGYLRDVTSDLRDAGITASHTITDSPIAESLLALATEAGSTLVAMTTHAREGLDRLARGSVTDRILRSGEVAVLVTRPTMRPLNPLAPGTTTQPTE
jgi:nucleotide-binding universal stress UspA family protein